MDESAKISYNAAVTRIRCEITRALTIEHEVPPADIVRRAKAKMEAVKASGEITAYVVYETRLKECWNALRQAFDEEPSRTLAFTLASGAPALPGLVVTAGSDKALISIAVNATQKVTEAWKWDWFKHWTQRYARELGVKEVLNNAQIYSAFARARFEGTIPPQSVSANPPAMQGVPKAFSVVGNKQRKEIGVVIRNLVELQDKVQRDHMLSLVNQAVRQMSTDGIEYRVLKRDFLAALQSALDGPEGLGVDLPLSLLAAVGMAKAGVAVPDVAIVVGSGPLQFLLSADRMEAQITNFDKNSYDLASSPVSVESVKQELQRHKVVLPVSEALERALGDAIHKRADLNGLVVCVGLPGEGGKGPYLHPSYKDAGGRNTDLDKAQLDLRSMQQRTIVRAQQLVAEIRYTTPPLPGRTIFDTPLLPPPAEPLAVQVGEGITRRGDEEFLAQIDGLPQIDELKISLSATLVHTGDVNLSTGNIVFDGPVEIKGNIDSGALVQTTSNLIVHGSIMGARVIVRGDLTVDDGITTGAAGLVTVRGSIKAQFIEQATVICEGDLLVEKALMNSQIYCSGTVTLAPGSVISGGKLYCLGSLDAGTLGTARGTITTVNVGVDWKVARSIEIKQKRIEAVKKRMQEERLALRDLAQKKPGQLTAKHKETKDLLQARIPRLRVITERLEQLIIHASSTLSYSATARVTVKETLYTNVHVTVCGQIVPVSNDVMEVAIVPKRVRGSFITPLEEAA